MSTTKTKKKKASAPTSHRGGRIESIGTKKQLITWHQGRGGKNIRRVVHGTRPTAEQILQKLREEFYGRTDGIRVDHDATVTDLAKLVVEDYQANAYKDLRGAKIHQSFWVKFAPTKRADTIGTDQLTVWANDWRARGLSPARVNRRIAFLLRGFKIALGRSLVDTAPKWKALKEAPPRSGTWTWDEFVKMRAMLPPHARVPVTIEYWFGTRSGETLSIGWHQVRFHHESQRAEVRFDALDTKTKEERTAFLGGDLYEVLHEWHVHTKAKHPTCTAVCHYNGQSIKSIKTSWQTACVKAGFGHWKNPEGKEVGNRGYRGKLVHDFRRTAVTRMVDAGIPMKTAMAISGHKTDIMFRRYHIVKKSNLIEAGDLLLAHHNREHGSSSTTESSSEKVFTKCSPTSQQPPARPVSDRVRPTHKKNETPRP